MSPMTDRSLILYYHEARAAARGELGLVMRPIQPQPDFLPGEPGLCIPYGWMWDKLPEEIPGIPQELTDDEFKDLAPAYCPYGQPGETRWVKGAWQEFFADELPKDRRNGRPGRMGIPARPDRRPVVAYRADGDVSPPDPSFGRAIWRSSVHMPRYASRFNSTCLGVEARRVQSVTTGEIERAGVPLPALTAGQDFDIDNQLWPSGVQKLADAFAANWDSRWAKKGLPWSLNPWAWFMRMRVEVENG